MPPVEQADCAGVAGVFSGFAGVLADFGFLGDDPASPDSGTFLGLTLNRVPLSYSLF